MEVQVQGAVRLRGTKGDQIFKKKKIGIMEIAFYTVYL